MPAGALLGGNLMSLAFSLTGGLLALGTMFLLLHMRGLSLFGVSVAGAAAHNTGQILAAHGGAGYPCAFGLPAAAAAVLPDHRHSHRRGLYSAGPSSTAAA